LSAIGALVGAGIGVVLAAAAFAFGAVDRGGAIAGAALSMLLFTCAGWRGLVLLALLVALTAAATRLGMSRKQAAGIAEGRRGRRGARQALANLGAGVLAACLARSSAHADWLSLAMVAAFATAAADTVSSEVGKAFAGRPLHPLRFERVAAGTRGAVSAVGTLAGAAAGAGIAATAWALGLVVPAGFLAALVGALAGTLLESVLGAHAPTASRVGHDALNALNTIVGAAVACGLLLVLR
jgi:uncharacterized protein (TIGR00297 family)